MRDGMGQAVQIFVAGSGDTGKVAFTYVGTVQKQHVEVNVQVQRTAKAPDQGDRTGLGANDLMQGDSLYKNYCATRVIT